MLYHLLKSKIRAGRKFPINQDPPTIYLEAMFYQRLQSQTRASNGVYA